MKARVIPNQQIIKNFKANIPPAETRLQNSLRAAVLILLIPTTTTDGKETFEILLTKRTDTIKNAGEICLPGGKMEEKDKDIIATAYREAYEEVGLPANAAQYLTHLRPFVSRQQIHVTPVVSLLVESWKPKPNPHEVADVFTLPFSDFILNGDHHSFVDITWYKIPYRLHHFQRNERFVFGFTANVLVEAARIGYGQEPGFRRKAPGQLGWKKLNVIILKHRSSL
ncbi:uncharacterized protein VTP21DRAFT_6595 [Calcarisporiella thermophila]|uniref:uncharacterized protein n=1 Tax=Calcarisporiella thermophila TaxID=911321 RepID=UPI0037421B27